jgi:2-polyprenyl-3-methyl-5-hydroxy-6-metoxy-1,4-benzoquinol methylase
MSGSDRTASSTSDHVLSKGLDADYTMDDHEFRDDDEYALAKYRLTLRWLRALTPAQQLLNVGCGGGVFNEMAFEAGYAVHGIEPDGAAYELAKRRAGARYDVTNEGLFDASPDRRSDVVVMHDVLEHIDAEGAAVDALAELVRPGGIGVVSVPALDSLFGYHDHHLGHFRRYTRTSLKRSLSTHFEIEKCRYLGVTGVPIVLWYSRVKNMPYPVSAANGGLISKVVRAACLFEERVPGPMGTSVIALIRPRR